MLPALVSNTCNWLCVESMLLYLSNLAHYGRIGLYSGSVRRKASRREWIASWISLGTG